MKFDLTTSAGKAYGKRVAKGHIWKTKHNAPINFNSDIFFNVREFGIQHLVFERKFQNHSLECIYITAYFRKQLTEFWFARKSPERWYNFKQNLNLK